MNQIINKDCLDGLSQLEDNSIDCIVTSPPYNKKGLLGKVKSNKNNINKKHDRYTYHEKGNHIWNKFEIDYNSYGDDMPEVVYQQWMISVLNEMNRVIKPDGSIFFNHKPRRHKNRSFLPTEFISQSDVNLYQLIIWNRRSSPNIRADILVPCTEHIYWLCKEKPKVYRNQIEKEYRGEVWEITPKKQADHPAPFPEQLVKNCVLLSTQENDIVLDPFMGSGVAAVVANTLDRQWLGFEIDEKYIEITQKAVEAFK